MSSLFNVDLLKKTIDDAQNVIDKTIRTFNTKVIDFISKHSLVITGLTAINYYIDKKLDNITEWSIFMDDRRSNLPSQLYLELYKENPNTILETDMGIMKLASPTSPTSPGSPVPLACLQTKITFKFLHMNLITINDKPFVNFVSIFPTKDILINHISTVEISGHDGTKLQIISPELAKVILLNVFINPREALDLWIKNYELYLQLCENYPDYYPDISIKEIKSEPLSELDKLIPPKIVKILDSDDNIIITGTLALNIFLKVCSTGSTPGFVPLYGHIQLFSREPKSLIDKIQKSDSSASISVSSIGLLLNFRDSYLTHIKLGKLVIEVFDTSRHCLPFWTYKNYKISSYFSLLRQFYLYINTYSSKSNFNTEMANVYRSYVTLLYNLHEKYAKKFSKQFELFNIHCFGEEQNPDRNRRRTEWDTHKLKIKKL